MSNWLRAGGRQITEKHVLARLAEIEAKMTTELLTAVEGEYPRMQDTAVELRRKATEFRTFLRVLDFLSTKDGPYVEAVLSVVPNQ